MYRADDIARSVPYIKVDYNNNNEGDNESEKLGSLLRGLINKWAGKVGSKGRRRSIISSDLYP